MTFKENMEISVIYGSQTGTASDAAHWFADKARTLSSRCHVTDGNSLATSSGFRPGVVYIFIVATAGNGDFPSNFRKLWSLLESRSETLVGCKFAIFGLGDSKYPQFNYAARKLFGKLVSLNAESICQLGCGDEQHVLGYSQEFIPWVKLLWSKLFGSEFSLESSDVSRNEVRISRGSGTGDSVQYSLNARVLENIRVSAESHFQDVRSMKFRLIGKWEYEAGDVLVVYPKVPDSIANKFIELLGLDRSDSVHITSSPSGNIAPGFYNLLELFTSVLDVTAMPSHVFYEHLFRAFSKKLSYLNRLPTDEEELVREKLDCLAAFSPEGANERLRYSGKERLGIFEVLLDFSQFMTLSLEDILDSIPPIQPRYYSVCNVCNSMLKPILGSSARVPVTDVEICVGLVEYTTLFGRKRVGLTSQFFKNVKVGQTVNRVFLERGFNTGLSQGLRDCSGVLLVGPGTGISPLRAIIHKYKHAKELLLFTGFRHEENDFLFRGEIETCFGSKKVTCAVAWSRPTVMDRALPFSWSAFPTGGTGCEHGRKTWVQDLVECEISLVRKCFESHSKVLIVICGRSHPMPKDVIEALEKVVGAARVKEISLEGRIVYDTWG
jgi:sulfite reductase alpha subunit-like flavoprotein